MYNKKASLKNNIKETWGKVKETSNNIHVTSDNVSKASHHAPSVMRNAHKASDDIAYMTGKLRKGMDTSIVAGKVGLGALALAGAGYGSYKITKKIGDKNREKLEKKAILQFIPGTSKHVNRMSKNMDNPVKPKRSLSSRIPGTKAHVDNMINQTGATPSPKPSIPNANANTPSSQALVKYQPKPTATATPAATTKPGLGGRVLDAAWRNRTGKQKALIGGGLALGAAGVGALAARSGRKKEEENRQQGPPLGMR